MRFTRTLYVCAVYLFFYLPIMVLIAFSFNASRFSWQWHGFSWRWYQELFSDTHLWLAAQHSLLLGFSAAIIATTIGGLAAISLRRYQFFGRQFLHGSLFILILAPDIVLGIALLLLFTTIELPLGFFSLLLAHTTFCIPFAAITIYSRLSTLDNNIFEAAIDLGASEFLMFRRVLIPLLWPAILAAFLLSFTLSVDDVIVSYFVAGPSFEILPLKIYSLVRVGVKPEINALCSIILCVTLSLVAISQFMLRKKQ